MVDPGWILKYYLVEESHKRPLSIRIRKKEKNCPTQLHSVSNQRKGLSLFPNSIKSKLQGSTWMELSSPLTPKNLTWHIILSSQVSSILHKGRTTRLAPGRT